MRRVRVSLYGIEIAKWLRLHGDATHRITAPAPGIYITSASPSLSVSWPRSTRPVDPLEDVFELDIDPCDAEFSVEVSDGPAVVSVFEALTHLDMCLDGLATRAEKISVEVTD